MVLPPQRAERTDGIAVIRAPSYSRFAAALVLVAGLTASACQRPDREDIATPSQSGPPASAGAPQSSTVTSSAPAELHPLVPLDGQSGFDLSGATSVCGAVPQGQLHRVDADSGEAVFSTEVPYPIASNTLVSLPATEEYPDGLLAFAVKHTGGWAVAVADPRSGRPVWLRAFGSHLVSGMAAVEGHLVVQSGVSVEAFNTDGTLRWSIPHEMPYLVAEVGTPGVAHDGTHVFIHLAGELRALNATDGTIAWATPVAPTVDALSGFEGIWGVSAADDLVLVRRAKNDVVTFDAANGQPLWSFQSSTRISAWAMQGPLLVLALSDFPPGPGLASPAREIVAVEVRSGVQRWRIAAPVDTSLRPDAPVDAVLIGESMVVTQDSIELVAYDTRDGSSLFTRRNPGYNGASPSEGMLVVLDTPEHAMTKTATALGKDGTPMWRTQVPLVTAQMTATRAGLVVSGGQSGTSEGVTAPHDGATLLIDDLTGEVLWSVSWRDAAVAAPIETSAGDLVLLSSDTPIFCD